MTDAASRAASSRSRACHPHPLPWHGPRASHATRHHRPRSRRPGLRHIRGILLHGPPGTGKTLVARKVGELLSARRPKLVAGPEIYNHLLGQSEQKIRDLFKQVPAAILNQH